jgi:hypothetical protein
MRDLQSAGFAAFASLVFPQGLTPASSLDWRSDLARRRRRRMHRVCKRRRRTRDKVEIARIHGGQRRDPKMQRRRVQRSDT